SATLLSCLSRRDSFKCICAISSCTVECVGSITPPVPQALDISPYSTLPKPCTVSRLFTLHLNVYNSLGLNLAISYHKRRPITSGKNCTNSPPGRPCCWRVQNVERPREEKAMQTEQEVLLMQRKITDALNNTLSQVVPMVGALLQLALG